MDSGQRRCGHDNEQMERIAGSIGAAPIFNDVMAFAHTDLPVEDWLEPPGLVHTEVCYPSGMLPTDDCPTTVEESFLYGHEPTTHDTLYQAFEINRENGKLATGSPSCPTATESSANQVDSFGGSSAAARRSVGEAEKRRGLTVPQRHSR